MLQRLSEMIGVSGYEADVIKYLMNELKDERLDNIYIDKVGNLICHKKGKTGNKRMVITAHVDEVGFQVLMENGDNEYGIKSLGNIKTWNAANQRVRSKKAIGLIYAKNEKDLKAYNYENLCLKILEGETRVGDVFAFQTELIEGDNLICGKALDNRISCYCLLEIIKKQIESSWDIIYVFTVQEEIGMRGVRVAKTSLNPDLLITLDVSMECDMNSIKVGSGVGIKISDSMGISSPKAVRWAEDVAVSSKLEYQIEVSDCGTSELIISNEKDQGCMELGISIPCKFLHSANTIVNGLDVTQCEHLIEELIRNDILLENLEKVDEK